MLIVQNQTHPAKIRNAIADLTAQGVAEIKVAAAYTTVSGSKMLLDSVAESVGPVAFAAMPKTLITSFDYGITEPQALDHWLSLGHSSVRVAGASEIAAGTTVPARAFHPKVYAFHVGDQTSGVLVASANLTGRGLTSNVEAGWVQHSAPSAEVDTVFSRLSADTDPLTAHLLSAYGNLRSSQPPPTNAPHDGQPVVPFTPATGALPLFRDAVVGGHVNLAAFDEMWVQVEKLQGGSGNQLELPRRGHRFFGLTFSQYTVPHADIGCPLLRIGSRVWADRPLTWHGSNGMERLNLPTQAQGGPDYSNSVVMFRRLPNAPFEIVVTPLNSDLAHAWARASQNARSMFRLGVGATTRLVGLN
ncbi:MAG: phospholipase D family protein [Gammaproteobacteria bacterium]|nr:phospholipase D family protein [Gammaproteobacteria bacterium]